MRIAESRLAIALDHTTNTENSGSWQDNEVAKQSTAAREIWFWILLLGSWIMLNSPAWPNQLLGALGTAAFLSLAFRSLGRLREMGMEFADWKPAPARLWLMAAGLGGAAGCVGLVLAALAHERIGIAENWRTFLLQVALGPVLEEIVFRGYLMRLLSRTFQGANSKWTGPATAVLISAGAFGGIHLLRPGTSAIAVAVISAMGIVYGFIRLASGSTAPAAVAHAIYNIVLHAGTAVSGR